MKINQNDIHQAFTAFSQMAPEQINQQMEGMNKAAAIITGLINASTEIANMFPQDAMKNQPELAQKMAVLRNYINNAQSLLPKQPIQQQPRFNPYGPPYSNGVPIGNIFNK